MSEEELKRFKEEQKYKNELFNDFALDSWCEESENIRVATNRITKEHFALLDIKEMLEIYLTTQNRFTGEYQLMLEMSDIINKALGDKENEI